MSLLGFYRQSVVRWCTWGLVSVILAYVACALTVGVSYGFMPLYIFISVVLSLFVSLSPLIFNHRDDTLMAQLPVTPAEKTVFYLLFSIIIVPVLLNGVWYLLCILMGLFLPVGNLSMKSIEMLFQQSRTDTPLWLSIVAGVTQTIFSIALTLWIVMCTRRSHRVARAVITYFGIYFVTGLIISVIGFYVGLHDGFLGLEYDPEDAETMAKSWILPLSLTIDFLALAVSVFLIRATYKHFKRI